MVDRSRLTESGTSRAIPARVAERAALAFIPDRDGCFISTYSRGSHGYAQIGWTESGRTYMTTAHRAAWTHRFGEIPVGMTVDHRCRVYPCVRREHLRLKTNVDNATDNGQVKTRPPAGRLCRRGLHELTMDARGKTACIECANERRRQRKAAAR